MNQGTQNWKNKTQIATFLQIIQTFLLPGYSSKVHNAAFFEMEHIKNITWMTEQFMNNTENRRQINFFCN